MAVRPVAGAGDGRGSGRRPGTARLQGAGAGRGRAAVVARRARTVHVVLPGDVDDPALPSGGNTYDRRVCDGLANAGWTVRPVRSPGAWPWPGDVDRDRLAATLRGMPGGATVLLDGLVACAAPDVVVRQANRLRLVVLVHLPLADETGLQPADAEKLEARERQTVRAATVVVATSEAVAARLITRHGLVPERVRVAAPGVARAPQAPGTADGRHLLSVASVTPRKGQDVLVEALAGLTGRCWTCICAGPLDRDRGYADRVRGQVISSRLRDRVRFVGPRDDAEVAALYAAADLVVLPSRAEPYGMVVTEALARGLPVLASAVDGIPEALGRAPDGELPGILVPAGDPAALAGAIGDWLGDPELRSRLRAAARGRRGELRGWAETTTAIAAVLEEVGSGEWDG